jgi:hypothetical protein
VNNNKLDLRGTKWNDHYWIYLAEDRGQERALVNMAINLQSS